MTPFDPMADMNDWTTHTLHRPPGDGVPDAPLLVLLHGYGSHEADLFSLAEALPQRYRVISLRAPYSTGWGGHAWYPLDWGPDGLKSDLNTGRDTAVRLNQAIVTLETQWGAPPGQTALLGFSQGAIVALAMGLGLPDRYDRILAYSGYWDGALLPLNRGNRVPELFIAHGTQDEVVPFEAHRKTVEAWNRLGLTFTPFVADYAHGIPPEALRAGGLLL